MIKRFNSENSNNEDIDDRFEDEGREDNELEYDVPFDDFNDHIMVNDSINNTKNRDLDKEATESKNLGLKTQNLLVEKKNKVYSDYVIDLDKLMDTMDHDYTSQGGNQDNIDEELLAIPQKIKHTQTSIASQTPTDVLTEDIILKKEKIRSLDILNGLLMNESTNKPLMRHANIDSYTTIKSSQYYSEDEEEDECIKDVSESESDDHSSLLTPNKPNIIKLNAAGKIVDQSKIHQAPLAIPVDSEPSSEYTESESESDNVGVETMEEIFIRQNFKQYSTESICDAEENDEITVFPSIQESLERTNDLQVVEDDDLIHDSVVINENDYHDREPIDLNKLMQDMDESYSDSCDHSLQNSDSEDIMICKSSATKDSNVESESELDDETNISDHLVMPEESFSIKEKVNGAEIGNLSKDIIEPMNQFNFQVNTNLRSLVFGGESTGFTLFNNAASESNHVDTLSFLKQPEAEPEVYDPTQDAQRENIALFQKSNMFFMHFGDPSIQSLYAPTFSFMLNQPVEDVKVILKL